MKCWKESQDEVRTVKKDLEMARSILKMIEVRLKAVALLNNDKFVSLKLEGYYEIIKEAITALMAIDGYKTLSHEVLIGYLKEFYDEFSDSEILLIDQLRMLRNKITYKGFFVQKDYLQRNETKIKEIIEKLNNIVKRKL
jgi:hypothetical protein